jgi:hypothetical protein
MGSTRLLPILILCLFAVALGCAKRVRRQVAPPAQLETLDGKAPFLKAHMRDGSLYVLSGWSVDSADRHVQGEGQRYEPDRSVVALGGYQVPLDSVALFETNSVGVSGSVIALTVMTGVTAGVTAYCATNPKACFGSCPTFYMSDGERELLQAEGFSASVAPSLEARDIDALYRARPPASRHVSLRMVNEALETHVVRQADLLVAAHAPGRRVFVDRASRFWSVPEPVAPVSCVAPEGACLDAVRAYDGNERFSAADSIDLATREVLELTFAPVNGERPALVLASRQSLLSTYLLYQAFAYMGTSVGEWLAAFERGDAATKRSAGRLVETLGGIEILARDTSGTWASAEQVLETGPLASDVRLVRLPPTRDSLRVRLHMAKGAWRVDYVALTTLAERVEPLRLAPLSVTGRDAAAHAKLLDSAQVLVTLPGDAYTLIYELPGNAPGYELFLESQGYYLEWMRQEWMAEEDKLAAMRLFLDPAGSLRALAPEFKREEPSLEAAFWSSKYVTP